MGRSNEFPYAEKSHIQISEKILLKENIFTVLTDYYRWQILPKKENENLNLNHNLLPELEIQDKPVGRPSIKIQLCEVYNRLKEQNKIEFSKTLTAHTDIINKTLEMMGYESISYKTISKHLGFTFKEDKNL